MTISLSLALFGTWSLPGKLANALYQDLIYIYIYLYDVHVHVHVHEIVSVFSTVSQLDVLLL